MVESLDLAERALLGIRIGESHYREFKSALEGPPGKKTARPARDLAVDVARTLVGFANADGGELLVGVEDDGTITGVPDQIDRQVLLGAPKTHVHAETPLPPPRMTAVELQDKIILYFHVPKGTRFIHLTSDGRCLKRVDRDTLPFAAEHIHAQRLEDASRGWDREIVDGATLDDLELDLVKTMAAQIAYGISVEKCLQHLDLAEFTHGGLRLRKAALVLFARDIRKWHSGCFVRVMTVQGKEKQSGPQFNIGKDTLVAENILRLVDRAWESLTMAIAQHTRFTSSSKFKQDLLYPQTACREALINAIAHRNYAIEGRGIEVSIFDDRMEVFSPGQLLSTISLDDIRLLRGAHESRNPLLTRVLREAGLVQEMGEGMRRIFAVMKSNSLAVPTLDNSTSGFTVTLFNKSLYATPVKLWLESFDELGLGENERAVVALGYADSMFSTQDIIDQLGIVDTDQVRMVVSALRNHGILQTARTAKEVERYKERHRIPRRCVPKFRIQGRNSQDNETSTSPSEQDDEVETFEIYLSNLPYALSRNAIFEWLPSNSDIQELKVPIAPDGVRNRGFAIVTMTAGKSTIEEYVEKIDGSLIDGRRVHARPARPKILNASRSAG